MRFAILSLLSLCPALLAAPLGLHNRDTQSDNIASSVSTANELGADLQAIIARIKSDPLTQGSAYEDNSHTSTYNFVQGLTDAFETAIEGTESLPSTLSSPSNPTAEILASYGPLVKAVTNTVFLSAIDLKLLSQDTIGREIPGFKDYTDTFDQKSYEYVQSLNNRYKGFINELANNVGKDTVLGQGLKALGGQTFYLLFDHISAS
ncbi:uncharacterized protein I303_100641 [Kwoniella dejecticola CBS 10117]|uniref:Uncharacterized protein n=1 Tax=Kwoniella dejecticola CBS 10117 TaxID=1296121 RepID=A0A1A6AFH5_9TREE|nr:uncharacterized protein I303_00644 [Kwoniella dejecticola CBS 10117]OBR88827.1 hypothetical protein I303_00644 [Kwoniella dejecticola CBS 10117]